MITGTRVLLYPELSIEYQKVLRVNIITPSAQPKFELASQSDSKVPSVESNLFLETNDIYLRVSINKPERCLAEGFLPLTFL